jgi:hypothetical protein
MTLRAMKAENLGASSCDELDQLQTPGSEYILKTDKEIAEEAKKKQHEMIAIENEEKLKMEKYFERQMRGEIKDLIKQKTISNSKNGSNLSFRKSDSIRYLKPG